MDILEKIVASTRQRVQRDKAAVPAERLQTDSAREPFLFERALAKPGMSFICEVKKASPSKGVIAEDFPYVSIARDYRQAGADAISVLTEPAFFLGSDAYLREIRAVVDTPLLRKDFVIDPYQIVQAKALGADAVLLICSILTGEQLSSFIGLADGLGLSSLVEAHDLGEVERAAAAGARIIGVNNRNLRNFSVDPRNSALLRRHVPAGVLFVSESGIRTRADIALLEGHGVDAALVGETLMRSPDKRAALDELRGRGQ